MPVSGKAVLTFNLSASELPDTDQRAAVCVCCTWDTAEIFTMFRIKV